MSSKEKARELLRGDGTTFDVLGLLCNVLGISPESAESFKPALGSLEARLETDAAAYLVEHATDEELQAIIDMFRSPAALKWNELGRGMTETITKTARLWLAEHAEPMKPPEADRRN